jgi:hypothetical protein
MTDNSNHPNSGSRDAAIFTIAPIIAAAVLCLLVGWLADLLVSPVEIAKAQQVQQNWIDAVSNTSTLSLAETFWRETVAVASGAPINPDYPDPMRADGNVLLAPLFGLGATLGSYFNGGGLTAIIQLGLGALCIATINYVSSSRRSIFYTHPFANIALLPIMVVLAASLIGLVLQWLMIGALNLFGGITSFAAYAMGAGGILATAWVCCVKLGGDRLQDAITKAFRL